MLKGKIVFKSLIFRIFFINITSTLAIIFMLIAYNGYISKKIEYEEREYCNQQTGILKKSIYGEFERIKNTNLSLMFNRDISDMERLAYYSTEYFDKVQSIVNSISLIRDSLPYTASINFFTNNDSLVVSDDGTYDAVVFENMFRRKYNHYPKELLSFNDIPEGVNIYDDFIFLRFIKNIETQSVLTIIPRNLFSEYMLRNFEKDGDIFFVYDKNEKILIKPADIEESEAIRVVTSYKYLNADKIEINRINYHIVADTNSDNSSLLVIGLYSTDNLQQATNDINNFTYILFVVFLVINVGMLFFHYRIYKPIISLSKSMKKQRTKNVGEVEMIRLAVQDLEEKNLHMSTYIAQTYDLRKKQLLLHFLTNQRDQVDSDSIKDLSEEYPYYLILTVMTENIEDTTILEDVFRKTYKFERVLSEMTYRVYCVCTSDNYKLYDYMKVLLFSLNLDDKLICGLSKIFKNIDQLSEAYMQSIRAIQTANAEQISKSSVCIFDTDILDVIYRISAEEEGLLTKHVIHGNIKGVEEFFEYLLKKMLKGNYKSFKRVYENLILLLENLILIRKEAREDIFKGPINIYNIMGVMRLHNETKKSFLQMAARCKSNPIDLLSKVKDYIEVNYNNSDLSINLLARKMGVTPEYLSSYFKRQTDMTPLSYINKTRIEKAIQLMASNHKLKISEIAQMVGIENLNTFTRQFKAYTGMTPTKYKGEVSD